MKYSITKDQVTKDEVMKDLDMKDQIIMDQDMKDQIMKDHFMEDQITKDDDVPWPMAGKAFSLTLFDIIKQATNIKQMKKGANEVVKTLNRDDAEFVVLAADCTPLAIILPLTMLCEDRNVPYAYVESKVQLGRACGVGRNVIAVSVTMNASSDLDAQIQSVKARIEQLAV